MSVPKRDPYCYDVIVVGAGHAGLEAALAAARMGRRTALLIRLLNRGKGPAMHSPRAQCDKKAYQFLAKLTVERQENLTLRQEMTEAILVEGGRAVGVRCRGGVVYQAR